MARLEPTEDSAAQRARSLESELEALRAQLDRVLAATERGAALVDEYRTSRRYRLTEAIRALKGNPRAGLREVTRFLRASLRHVAAESSEPAPSDPLASAAASLNAVARDAARSAQASPFPAGQPARAGAGHVVIFAGVPFDDIGGGQRSAQLARALLRRFYAVTYVYAFPKSDASAAVSSARGLRQLRLEEAEPASLLEGLPEDARIVFEIPHRGFLPFLRLARARGLETVFELIDDWQSSLGGGWFDLEVMREFATSCTLSVATARVLIERLRALGVAEPQYLPNAADDTLFDADRRYPRPTDLPAGFDAHLVYFGSLYGEWFAWDYLRAAARAAPRKALVVIGDARGAPSMPSNVFFLGPRANEELPAYLAAAEAALIPFKPCAITEAVSPIKVFEYLHMRRPVIAGRMRELDGMPGVFQASSAQEFAALCAQVPAADPEPTAFIAESSWDCRVDSLLRPAAPRRRFSFIILIHDNRAIIGRCLDTLLRHTRGFDAEYLVVDNASRDGGAELVEERYPGVRLLRNARNGCSSGRNLGARAATGDCLVFLDSDQWFTSSAWCHEAALLLREHAGLGAISWAAGSFASGGELAGGPTMDDLPARGHLHPQVLSRGFRTDVAYLGSGGMFIPRAVWSSIAGFDEAFDPTAFEDTDLSFQIRAAGFRLAYRSLTGVHHQAHATTRTRVDAAYSELFTRNAARLKDKWRGRPDLFEPQR